MDSWVWTFSVVASAALGLWLLSHVMEALRPVPKTPATLRWAPEIPIHYVEVDGSKRQPRFERLPDTDDRHDPRCARHQNQLSRRPSLQA